VLLLDEPTNGVDPVSRRELWQLLHEFVGEGMAVLLSTAYMDEAARCHRVCMLHAGRVMALGEPKRLVRELDYPVYEVLGGERESLYRTLADAPGVVAASPAGERLRVILRMQDVAAIEASVVHLGARLDRVTADFEDVFLARTYSADHVAPSISPPRQIGAAGEPA